MAQCRFCGKEFSNKQAVRAHLKGCTAYLGRFSRQPALPQAKQEVFIGNGEASAREEPEMDFDPVRQMQKQVSAEKLRLRLREVGQAHAELDARDEARRSASTERETRETQLRRQAEQQRDVARVRVLAESNARREAEEVKQRLMAKRRAAIQQAKVKVVDEWWGQFGIGSALKAQILLAIEANLAPLTVDEIPQAELVQIAEAVRDRLCSQSKATQDAAAALQQQVQALQRYGLEYAQAALREIDGLDLLERWRMESLVREQLKDLAGNKSRLEVKAWVDEILEGEGFEDDDEYDSE